MINPLILPLSRVSGCVVLANNWQGKSRIYNTIVNLTKEKLPTLTSQPNNKFKKDPLSKNPNVRVPNWFSRDFPYIPDEDSPDFEEWAKGLSKTIRRMKKEVNRVNKLDRATRKKE